MRKAVHEPLFVPQGRFDSDSVGRGLVRREGGSNPSASAKDNNPWLALGDKAPAVRRLNHSGNVMEGQHKRILCGGGIDTNCGKAVS